MVATWNRAASVTYYQRQAEYYLGGVEPAGRWYAPGHDFGLADGAEIDNDVFELLYWGADTTGDNLISNRGARAAERVPAYDYTFSAPKSVALTWAFGSYETKHNLGAAQERAARAALAMLEREACFARRGHSGSHIEQVKLTAALFQHGESRPAEHQDGRLFGDPNLHTHAVIVNLATRTDGTIGALHSVVLRNWKMAAGAMYHAALAHELHDLGFSIDRLGKNGIFEIAGVEPAHIDYFSARRRGEIETELAAHGVTSREASALAAAIAKATRGGKQEHISRRREEIWTEAARSRGMTVDDYCQKLRQCQPSMTVEAGEKLLAERLAALPAQLTETESVVDRRTLLRAVAAAFVGTLVPCERVETEIANLLDNGYFVEIGRDAIGLPRYSTPEMITLERETVACAERLAQQDRFALDHDKVLRRSQEAGLTDEQIIAALAATTASAVAIAEGAPGSGKTTLLAPIVGAYQAAGFRVIGAATAWRVANTLRDDLGVEARATASWLERGRLGKSFLDSRTILVVDEGGLIASREMHGLIAQVEQARAKILLVGDRQQLQAIGAGAGLSLIARAVEASRVDTIVRQHQVWARTAILAFGQGHAAEALDAFAERGHVIEAEGAKAAIDAVVECWRTARIADGEQAPLILARTNAQVGAISRVLREHLRAEGAITGPEIVFEGSTPSGHTTEIALAVGDEIRFLARNDKLGVVNGTTAKVSRIEHAANERGSSGSSVRCHVDLAGRRIQFCPEELADAKGRIRLGWGYVSTVFGAQGITVDKAVVLLDPGFDRHAVYVAASRARSETTFVVDAKAIDKKIAAELPFDLQNKAKESTPEARRAWLATRLRLAHVKETTLDVLTDGVAGREKTQPEYSRALLQREMRRDLSREQSLD